MTAPGPPARRRFRRAALLLFLLALLAAAGGLAGRRLWADHHFRRALEAEGRRDFEAAYRHGQHCLSGRPDRAGGHLFLARVARRGGQPDQAREHLARARELGAPADAVALENALLLAQAGDLAD